MITELPGESHPARYHRWTLETVGHHLKPKRQLSVGSRQLRLGMCGGIVRRGIAAAPAGRADGQHCRAARRHSSHDKAASQGGQNRSIMSCRHGSGSIIGAVLKGAAVIDTSRLFESLSRATEFTVTEDHL